MLLFSLDCLHLLLKISCAKMLISLDSDTFVKKSNVSNLGIADNASSSKLSKCDTDNEIT